jgi:hypothetical protein
MDPNETLRRLRDLSQTIIGADENESEDALALAELVQAMDGWLKRGGFLPTEWNREE